MDDSHNLGPAPGTAATGALRKADDARAEADGARAEAEGRRPRAGRRRLLTALLAALTLLAVWVGSATGQSLLVLGIDRREGDRGRSDTMLVIHPRLGGGLTLLSVPRDTRVELPDVGTTKVNAAYARGGGALAAQAVTDLIGRPVTGYVVVDFEAVRAVVDALGGVTVHVESAMRYRDPRQDLEIDLEPGLRRLNGEEALGYLRFRADRRGDIGRVERQRAFLKSLVREVLKPVNWPRLPAVYAAFRQHAETELGTLELARFAAAAAVAAAWGMEEATLPGRPATVNGASYWLHDPEATAELVQRLFGAAGGTSEGSSSR